MDGVEKTMRVMQPFKVASRDFSQENTVIDVGGVKIGGPQIVVMAGPCSVESREMLLETAHAVKEAGATILRRRIAAPSPYELSGLGEEGRATWPKREQIGLPVITEVMTPEDTRSSAITPTSSRSAHATPRTTHCCAPPGKQNKPVFLKRGMSSTIQELLMSAEYILSGGNMHVMVCERGIRTFEPLTRFTFDVNAIPVIKEMSHLPIVADPAHGTGKWSLVAPVAMAAVAAGADAIMVEVHPDPTVAWSDGAQSLTPARFAEMMKALAPVAQAVGRTL